MLNKENNIGGIQLGTIIGEPEYLETGTYVLVRVDSGDEVMCKQLNPYAGDNFGTRYPLAKDNRVLVAFIENNPNEDAFILGCLYTEDKPFNFGGYASNEDRNQVFIKAPANKKIIETSGNKTIEVTKSDDLDGDYGVYAENAIQIGQDYLFSNQGQGTQPGIDIVAKKQISIASLEENVYVTGQTVRLGADDAGNNAVKGPILQDILKSLVSALDSTSSSPAISPADKTAILGRLENILSNMVYVAE
jgi:hypothetical protein